ncbi:MAG: 5-formyltetrahydrofolate cyclo-ligase, partial [Eggerthella lenta]
METKKQLRSRVLARRDALPEEVRARKSAAICARLEQVLAEALAGAEGAGTAQVSAEGTSRADATGGSAVPTVAVFASMRSEVDTRPFVEAAYAHGWDVCFPC